MISTLGFRPGCGGAPAVPLIWACVLVLISGLAGCNNGNSNTIQFAPVSGTVTLDEKPLVGARVLFMPQLYRLGEKAVLPVSVGETDEQGRFQLKQQNGKDGAVVTRHMVWIVMPTYPDQPSTREVSMIPARYNSDTILDFHVPPGGTDHADFPLASDAEEDATHENEITEIVNYGEVLDSRNGD